MVILTTENIKNIDYKKVSSVVEYGLSKFCLAEVDDSFNFSQKEVDEHDLGFWWAIDGAAYIDTEQWDYDQKYKGGLIEGIELVYNLSKENNIAMVINTLAHNAGLCPFELWEEVLYNQSETKYALS